MIRYALAAILLTTPTFAHDLWADGTTVPPWVKSACCGPDDVHHLLPSQVHIITTNGVKAWKVDGYDDPIPIGRELQSQDGDYWIFYSTRPDGTQTPVYCFFAPLNGT